MNVHSVIRRILRRDPNFEPQKCYGQDGEDLIVDRILGRQQVGFYVDVGAHHPVRFSNTYMFYRRGWRGINIDAEPGSMRLFQRYRPLDINIECGVAARAGQLKFHRFNEPALNTFDSAEAALKDRSPYKIIETVDVCVERLDSLLERHLPPSQTIDLLSVDVEGKDAEVLSSNDWTKFRPRLVLAETLRADLLSIANCPVSLLLGGVGYKPVAKAFNTVFFAQGDQA
ncbi:FkbM family methyltransferase [Hyphomicrobium sp. xq]|uniref:FkbM family methyltransferase n=1 Tax=Hyphomicrobium album TaxID=2665159 RepID=A0A6I3KJZ0_9HYPH|nr:FkbM family methyltransferase [Hyphomicrobium album]MTD94663.1 FkbM family methyltransferase [Hyphomicrobium album]